MLDMKILIIGAGATGSIIAKTLADRPEIEQILIGDIDPYKIRVFLAPHPKISSRVLNAEKVDEVAAVLDGFNLLINASLPKFNENLMTAALIANANYQDLASEWENGKIEQLKFHEKFKEKNLTALFNASASPGVTNLIAGELASQLKRIEYIKIRLLEDVSSDVPFTAWSKTISFDEFYTKPWAWIGNKFVNRKNFSEEEIYDFPAPYINQKCYLLAQEDVGTIPLYIKTKYADLKAGGGEIEFARTLFNLGFFRKRLVKVGNALVSPYDFVLKIWPDVPSPKEMKTLIDSKKLHDAHFWAVVEARGFDENNKKITKKATIIFPSQIEVNKLYPGANYISYAAGLTAAIFALYIPKIKEKGAFPPEALEKDIRTPLIEELEKNNIRIEIQVI